MPREQPAQSYAPRAKAKIILRLEDFGAKDTPKPPVKPPHVRGGKGVDDKGQLTITLRNGAYVLGSGAGPNAAGGTPQAQTTSADGRTFVVDAVVPTRATLMRNSVRQADTLTLTLRYLDFPFDPRALRSVGVQFYLGTLQDADLVKELDGSKRFLLPDTFQDSRGRTRSNLRFEGWVLEYSEDVDDEGEALVVLECADNTTLLIDQEAPAKLTVPPDKPIDQAFATYLANFPQFRGLSVQYRPVGATPPMLKTALAKTAFRAQLGPPPSGGAAGGGGGGGAGGGGSKLMVWDYLTDVAGTVGLIVFFSGTTIVVQRPRTLYASKFSGRPDDPYTGRILPDGRNLPNRTFIYGRNVSRMGFKRKFTKHAPQNVEVRAWSSKLGVTQAVRFPGVNKDGQRQPKLLPGDNADETWKVFTVSGIDDLPTLRAAAQGIYENLGRSEFTGRISTMNLASFGGGQDDPDVLDCEAGDAVELQVARAVDGESSLGASADAVANRAAAYLVSLGFDQALATAYGKTITNVGVQSTFRVRTVSFDFDGAAEGGGDGGSLKVDLEVVNFLEVRSSKDLPAGEELEPTAAGNPQPEVVRVEDTAAPQGGTQGVSI